MWVYIFDTSAFIDLYKHYPQDIFPGLWDKFLKLCKSGRIKSHITVKEEILTKDDELTKTIKRLTIFENYTQKQVEIVKEIIKNTPNW